MWYWLYSLDGKWMDHDAGRMIVFLVLAIFFAGRAFIKDNSKRRSAIAWSLWNWFLFAWTFYDHFRPLRIWLPTLYGMK